MNCSQKVIGFLVLSALLTLCFPSRDMSPGSNLFSLHGVALAAELDTNEDESFATEEITVADPLEPVNRFFFHFNDKLYFWVLRPISFVYGSFIPEGVRIGIRNAFHNIAMPVRVVNCAFQGKGSAMGTELGRFVINSTLGFGGMIDFAYNEYDLKPHDEDTGQTFGAWGMPPLMYVNLPLFGPSSIRDGLGMVGDGYLNPIYYLTPNQWVAIEIKAGKEVNATSLRLGEYEDFKKSALDPYISMRDAYIQYRAEEIRR